MVLWDCSSDNNTQFEIVADMHYKHRNFKGSIVQLFYSHVCTRLTLACTSIFDKGVSDGMLGMRFCRIQIKTPKIMPQVVWVTKQSLSSPSFLNTKVSKIEFQQIYQVNFAKLHSFGIWGFISEQTLVWV